MNAQSKFSAVAATLPEILGWHETRAAQNILRNIDAMNAPASCTVIRQGVHEDRRVVEYDREDPRVITLHAIAETWFEMAEAYAPLILRDGFADVDEQISAAIDAAVRREAELDRVAALLLDGFTLGDARRMAGEVL
jgi:hypothetical protein